MKSFFVLTRGLRGVINGETVLVVADNWLANPKKDLRSHVRLVGFGKFEIASVIDLST